MKRCQHGLPDAAEGVLEPSPARELRPSPAATSFFFSLPTRLCNFLAIMSSLPLDAGTLLTAKVMILKNSCKASSQLGELIAFGRELLYIELQFPVYRAGPS